MEIAGLAGREEGHYWQQSDGSPRVVRRFFCGIRLPLTSSGVAVVRWTPVPLTAGEPSLFWLPVMAGPAMGLAVACSGIRELLTSGDRGFAVFRRVPSRSRGSACEVWDGCRTKRCRR